MHQPKHKFHWLVTLSMPENSAGNSKYHCSASIVTIIQGVSMLITSSGMYRTSKGYISSQCMHVPAWVYNYFTGGAFEVWLQ